MPDMTTVIVRQAEFACSAVVGLKPSISGVTTSRWT